MIRTTRERKKAGMFPKIAGRSEPGLGDVERAVREPGIRQGAGCMRGRRERGGVVGAGKLKSREGEGRLQSATAGPTAWQEGSDKEHKA